MTDQPCENNEKLELFLNKYPYPKKLTSDQVEMIRGDVKRLMRFNVSKKAIDRLYHTSIASLAGQSLYGLSEKQTFSTFQQTCTIAWKFRDWEEKQEKMHQGIFSRIFNRIKS